MQPNKKPKLGYIITMITGIAYWYNNIGIVPAMNFQILTSLDVLNKIPLDIANSITFT